MLRATNTGATAIIDHRGVVTARLPPFTRGVLDGEVTGRDGLTPFAWWSARFGLWPWLVLALATVAFALSRPRAPGFRGAPR
jgi:apolipoprotein N-acyltransferase